jgi:hypothetical protein
MTVTATKINSSHECGKNFITWAWPASTTIIYNKVIYATRFYVNWAFLIARGARLQYERSEDFKASRAIRKAQFAQKRVAYKLLLFETTSLKLPNLLKIISHLLLTVLTNFSRNVTLNVLSRATVGYLLFFALEQLGGSLQRRKMRIYDS